MTSRRCITTGADPQRCDSRLLARVSAAVAQWKYEFVARRPKPARQVMKPRLRRYVHDRLEVRSTVVTDERSEDLGRIRSSGATSLIVVTQVGQRLVVGADCQPSAGRSRMIRPCELRTKPFWGSACTGHRARARPARPCLADRPDAPASDAQWLRQARDALDEQVALDRVLNGSPPSAGAAASFLTATSARHGRSACEALHRTPDTGCDHREDDKCQRPGKNESSPPVRHKKVRRGQHAVESDRARCGRTADSTTHDAGGHRSDDWLGPAWQFRRATRPLCLRSHSAPVYSPRAG